MNFLIQNVGGKIVSRFSLVHYMLSIDVGLEMLVSLVSDLIEQGEVVSIGVHGLPYEVVKEVNESSLGQFFFEGQLEGVFDPLSKHCSVF